MVVENQTVVQCFHFVCRRVVRLAASLLEKLVDSIAPSISTMLVSGKQVRQKGGNISVEQLSFFGG